MILELNHKNIILNQLNVDSSSFKFIEVYPVFTEDPSISCVLALNEKQELVWLKYSYEPSININLDILDSSGRIKNTNLYYLLDKIGIGREPLLNYKLDIGIPSNELTTGFHIGDGTYGFSMGNGTSFGFVPEIIGMGSNETDAGLYFIGKAGNDISSNIPLVIIDGRNSKNSFLENRPILGITSFNYEDYKLLIDQYGRIGVGKIPETYKFEVEGTILTKDLKISCASENLSNIDYDINGDLIYNIKPIKYRLNEKNYYGFVAEEVNEIIPSLVGLKNEKPNDISYTGFIPLLVKTIQNQQNEIQSLKQRILNIEKILNI